MTFFFFLLEELHSNKLQDKNFHIILAFLIYYVIKFHLILNWRGEKKLEIFGTLYMSCSLSKQTGKKMEIFVNVSLLPVVNI